MAKSLLQEHKNGWNPVEEEAGLVGRVINAIKQYPEKCVASFWDYMLNLSEYQIKTGKYFR